MFYVEGGVVYNTDHQPVSVILWSVVTCIERFVLGGLWLPPSVTMERSRSSMMDRGLAERATMIEKIAAKQQG